MHTRIALFSYLVWVVVLLGQVIVAAKAFRRANHSLAAYLALEVSISLSMFATARLCPADVYYRAYLFATCGDYMAQALLVTYIYRSIRNTGVPSKAPFGIVHLLVFTAAITAIASSRIPLDRIHQPEWRWLIVSDHVVTYWVGIMLIFAPVFSWLIDSARCVRVLFLYLGFVIYVAVHAVALNIAVSSRLAQAAAVAHIPDFAYLVSLLLWLLSSDYPYATHKWDSDQTILLKQALRSKRRMFSTPPPIEREQG